MGYSEAYPASPVSSTNLTPLTPAMGFQFSKSAYRVAPNTANNLYYCASSDQKRWVFGVIAKSGAGYVISSDGGLREDIEVNGANVCALVGRASTNTWILGFYPSGSGWAEWTN